MVSEERWDKLKGVMECLRQMKHKSLMDRKELERIYRFLVCVSLACNVMVLCLEGICLSLKNWRPDRDEEGWSLPKQAFEPLTEMLQEQDACWS